MQKQFGTVSAVPVGEMSQRLAINHNMEVCSMAQKVTGFIKLQIPAGKATPAPPVGPALGSARCKYYGVHKGIQRAHQE